MEMKEIRPTLGVGARILGTPSDLPMVKMSVSSSTIDEIKIYPSFKNQGAGVFQNLRNAHVSS